MYRKAVLLLIGLATALLLIAPAPIQASRNNHSQPAETAMKAAAQHPNKPHKPGELKSFGELTKDLVKIEGLFTFYHDTTDNSMLMAIKPEQLNVIYAMGMTMSRGDGAFLEAPRMFGTDPIYFQRVGNQMMLMEKNLRIRADSTSVMLGAVESGLSDGLLASTAVKSEPDDSTKAVLVDPSDFFIRDALNLTYMVGQEAKTGLRFDGRNSYFGTVKSFPENSEINVHLNYATNKPMDAVALQNPYNFYHVFHYSLYTIPESDYVPRYADDRVGFFQTVYQEYDRLDRKTPYVYYINRWNLKKKDPNAAISEPVKPIVYWIENTVPEEYRQALVEGVEFWNKAFEKIGFRNAIVAKIMPDTATWDPADVRYNTIRWLVSKNNPYVAIGPSRANPYTGEIYDADVGILADAVMRLYSTIDRQVRPLTKDAYDGTEYDPFGEMKDLKSFSYGLSDGSQCRIGDAAYEASEGLSYLLATTDVHLRDKLAKKYVHQFLRFVVAHEVGHTLGFKHNFMASSIYTMDQINDTAFTNEHGMLGTVMDYPAPNIAGPDKTQGDFYGSVPGPYDDWAIAYGYEDFGAKTPDDEVKQLDSIASRAADPGLAYASDEDTFGSSMKSIDPRTNIWDLSSDPIGYFDHMCGTSQEIWHTLIKEFEKPGNRFQEIRYVFGTAFSPYIRAAQIVPKYIGGLYHNRYHIGDAEGADPFTPVPVDVQRRAMNFLSNKIFAADAFTVPSDLVNKLQQETRPDFQGTIYTRPSIDYPLLQVILSVQETALSRLYSPVLLKRLVNDDLRHPQGDDRYTMYDMFTDVRRSIWGEVVKPEDVSATRRQLQMSYLRRIINIYLSAPGKFPTDATTLAANDLSVLQGAAQKAVQSGKINDMTRAHFREALRQIKAAQDAKREYSAR